MGIHPYLRRDEVSGSLLKKGAKYFKYKKGLQKGASNVGSDHGRKGNIKKIFNFADAFAPCSSRFIFSTKQILLVLLHLCLTRCHWLLWKKSEDEAYLYFLIN